MNNVTQISEGLSQSLGIDIKTLLTVFLGGKIGSSASKGVTVNVEPVDTEVK